MARLVHLLVLLLAALSAVSARPRSNKCPKGFKAYPIKRGRIASSFEAGGVDNYAADLLRRVVEDKGEKRGCKIVAIAPVKKACGKVRAAAAAAIRLNPPSHESSAGTSTDATRPACPTPCPSAGGEEHHRPRPEVGQHGGECRAARFKQPLPPLLRASKEPQGTA